ncbi:MAG: 50S ribosomal protein L3 [Verrucomicrobiota bacterium]
MKSGVIGIKAGMTRVYDDAGEIRPATVVTVDPNVVIQVKSKQKEGYDAIQVGMLDQKESRLTKPVAGHFKKAGVATKRFVREFRTEGEEFKVGDKLSVERFTKGMIVDVIGTSKGHGFSGTIKRHNFHGQPAAHGSKMHRRNGSIGTRSTPGLVFKNKGMPGHFGDVQITIQNLEVLQVRPEDNAIVISGAVPGGNGTLVVVRPAIKGQPKPKAVVAAKAKNPMKESKGKK